MDFNTFLVSMFTLIDDWVKTLPKLRQRGPAPRLSDSEVLTIEVAGAFLGFDTDKETYHYFRRHYGHWFPALQDVHRTTYARQAANLWVVKAWLWKTLVAWVRHDPTLSIIDSVPIPICRFARAPRCRRLRAGAAYGYDPVARHTFLGFRAHARICWPGVITDLDLVAADISELAVAEQLLQQASGTVLADRGYWKPDLTARLRARGVQLLAPFKFARHDKAAWPTSLKQARYRIETVFSQLVARFRVKQVWARDTWHLTARWYRVLVAHTFGIFFCQQLNLSDLQFSAIFHA